MLRALAGAHHDGGGRGQAQRAGAGDDQDGDKDGEREGLVPRAQIPGDACDEGDHKHGGHKDAGYLVGQFGDGRLAALGFLHQANDLRQRRIIAHLLRPHAEGAGGVDGGGIHAVTRVFINGHAFAGQHGLIHRRVTIQHHAVHRDASAGAHQQHVAHLHILKRDFDFLVPAD